MAATRKPSEPSQPRRAPATSPEARENQVISLAIDLAEKQIREGTVSSQVLSYYVRLGSTRERLEQERLMREVELLEKKAEGMASAARVEALYEDAIAAMRSYGGHEPEQTFDD